MSDDLKIIRIGEDKNPVFFCPGCKNGHKVWVHSPNEISGSVWGWNGSHDKPTFTPSIKVKGHRGGKDYCCHSQVTDGIINFYGDSTHELTGKAVPLEAF